MENFRLQKLKQRQKENLYGIIKVYNEKMPNLEATHRMVGHNLLKKRVSNGTKFLL